mgnify:FL=1
MKKTQVFKKVAEHLLQQKVRSVNAEEDFCMYKHPENELTCAVGCLITDAHYYPSLEGNAADSTVVRNAIAFSLATAVNKQDAELLCKLQDVHDYDDPQLWREKLNEVAEMYFNKNLEELGVAV